MIIKFQLRNQLFLPEKSDHFNYMTIQEKYNKLIEKFLQDCERYSCWVFNKNLLSINISKVKYILVADNPGDREKEHGVYLYAGDNKDNTAGKIAADFCEHILEPESFLVLNKCPISTTSSADLKKLPCYKEKSYKKALEYMAQLIYNINELIPHGRVIIFGTTGTFTPKKHKLSKSGLWSPFYKKIRELYKKKNPKPILIKHFCYHKFIEDFFLKNGVITVCTDTKEKKNLAAKGYKKMTKEDLKTIGKKTLMDAFKKSPYSEYLFRNGGNRNTDI